MKLKFKVKLKRMLLCAAFILYITSCNSGVDSYVFKTAIYGNPSTLDPQCAGYDSSVSVLYNVFQGLFAFDSNGDVINGIAESYTVSDDGLKWTFKLKENVKWSDGGEFIAECTAEDFVFAFERLFKPATKSERANEYFVIKNSEAINRGELKDLSLLGVKALDTYKLEIELEEPCADFAALLAMPPAMPCNKEFFESTQGRYGLAADCIVSNSNYYVHTWSYDEWSDENNYFILRKNAENFADEGLPVGINFFIDSITERKDFEDSIMHAYMGKNAEEIKELSKNYNFSEYRTDVWGIIFNQNGSFSELNYRLSLADDVIFSAEDGIYNSFSNIIPECVLVGSQRYRNIAGDIEKNFITVTESDVGMLTSARFIMPKDAEFREEIGGIMQKWQSKHNFYCNISELAQEDYNSALNSGDFDIALVKLSGEYNSPYAYLNDFMPDNSKNYGNYSNKKFVHIMNSAFTSKDSDDAALFYKEAEQLLIDNAVFVPLCIETGYVFYSDDISGVEYNPFLGVYSQKGD